MLTQTHSSADGRSGGRVGTGTTKCRTRAVQASRANSSSAAAGDLRVMGPAHDRRDNPHPEQDAGTLARTPAASRAQRAPFQLLCLPVVASTPCSRPSRRSVPLHSNSTSSTNITLLTLLFIALRRCGWRTTMATVSSTLAHNQRSWSSWRWET